MNNLSLKERNKVRLKGLRFLEKYPEVFSIGTDRAHGYSINREFLPMGFYLKEGLGANSRAWLIERDYKEEVIREIIKWMSENLDEDFTYVITKPEKYTLPS